MSRIAPIDPATATGRTAELFSAVKQKLGGVPNLMRTFGQSPAALEAYLGLSGALGTGVLPAAVREQIALAVGEANGCGYCLAAHSLIGRKAGLAPDQITDARRGRANDAKVAALLTFARAVVDQRGHVSDEQLAAVRTAGATEAEIVETVVNVVLNILTNYTNHLAETVIDFPAAPPLPAS